MSIVWPGGGSYAAARLRVAECDAVGGDDDDPSRINFHISYERTKKERDDERRKGNPKKGLSIVRYKPLVTCKLIYTIWLSQ